MDTQQLIFFVLALIAFLVSYWMFRECEKREGYAYEYPYSFFQCAEKRCPFEDRRAPYLTDEDSFVRVY